jgi:hypothetical protein
MSLKEDFSENLLLIRGDGVCRTLVYKKEAPPLKIQNFLLDIEGLLLNIDRLPFTK